MLTYLQQLDASLLVAINGWHCPFADQLMWLISGKFSSALILITLLALSLRKGNWKKTLFLLIGKSECAVELLKRGHRLIADDAVEIRKVSAGTLMGTAPALIRNYVELRGIGIINVAKLFGMGSVKLENEINLVMNIVPWNTLEAYDRLGLEEHYTEILGVKVPMNTIPITPGRNLAVILEVAAMNNRQKKMGYNAALEFTEQINRHFDENIGKI